MNERATGYSDREIINRWAVAEIDPGISRLLSAKGPVHPDANGCIGYFYIDHEEGITFRIHALCRRVPGRPTEVLTNFEAHGENLILRYDEVGAHTLLSNEEANDLSFLEEERWHIYYAPDSLREIRNRVDLDRFRAPGFFDDVSVILLASDQERIPEVVWVRLEELSADGKSFKGILLNEPDMDFGVHDGDMLTVCFVEHEEGRFLVAEIQTA